LSFCILLKGDLIDVDGNSWELNIVSKRQNNFRITSPDGVFEATSVERTGVNEAIVVKKSSSGSSGSSESEELSSDEVTELYNSGSPGDLDDHSAVANLLSWWYLNTADNFPTEVDVIDSVNGTLTNMESGDYDSGDIP